MNKWKEKNLKKMSITTLGNTFHNDSGKEASVSSTIKDIKYDDKPKHMFVRECKMKINPLIKKFKKLHPPKKKLKYNPDNISFMYEDQEPLFRKTEYFTKLGDKSFYLREKTENERKLKNKKRGRLNTPFRIR